MRALRILILTTTLGVAPIAAAHAGSSQAADPVLAAAEIRDLSRQIEQALAERGAYVALVARTGRDPEDLPKGVRYTHVAFWVYSDLALADGGVVRAYRVHNLYQQADRPHISDLIEDNPVDFVAGAVEPGVGIVIPTVEVQARLIDLLSGPVADDLHNPSYSVLANPDNNRFQNCTEYSLNLLVAALHATGDIGVVKREIAEDFTAQRIRLNPFARAFGPVFLREVRTSDHRGAIRTATFTTIFRYLDALGVVQEAMHLTPDGVAPLPIGQPRASGSKPQTDPDHG
ncbi:MAG: DUF2145 domain-containing protein [Pseudomonadota bacterium]